MRALLCLLLTTGLMGCGAAHSAPTSPPVRSAPQLPPIEFDTKGVDFKDWEQTFRQQVRHNWFIAVRDIHRRGRVRVSCRIHADGRITDVAIVQSSGYETMDRAAAYAVTASSPAPALPPGYPQDELPLTLTFFYGEPAASS